MTEPFRVGLLTAVPASDRHDLLAGPARDSLASLDLLGEVGVVEIDPALSETSSSRDAFALHADQLANCVVVAGRREGQQRFAACVVLSTTRADVNGFVRRHLDVRKASFVDREEAVALTGMEYGGITPFGLPARWPVLVDRAVADAPMLVLGSGVRHSKLVAPGAVVARLPGAEIVEGLGLPT
jgi:prolyl-tRNA editing enzyme YbaK/EbsC (Cys-tRNA(Pro) deacylase)